MAVTNPTAEQRRSLPDAAFAAVFETGAGKRRILPHHVNTARSATDNASVDVPRLRNAFARFNQLKSVSKAVKAKAMAHLQTHADAVLRRDDSDAAGLRALVDDFGRGFAIAHHYSLHDVPRPTPMEVLEAEEMRSAARAAIQLLDGETLDAFRQALGDAVKLAWSEIVGEYGYCYLETIFDNTVIAYIRAEDQPACYVMHAWMRTAGGDVVLGAPAKVRPVLSYEPDDGPLPTAAPAAPTPELAD